MLFFGSQVIAVILAVSLHHGNGRAITSTSNDDPERILDLADEELKGATPVLRQKRSHHHHEGPCYTGEYKTVKLASGGVKKFPICEIVSLTGCGSSIKKYAMRKCVGSDNVAISVRLANGANQTRVYPRKCSCAV